MDKGTVFDAWWRAQSPKPAMQKGTLRRGWDLGASYERARLRPLLVQCLVVAEEHGDNALSADLRRELGLPEEG